MMLPSDFDELHSKIDFHQFSPFILNELDRLDTHWRSKRVLEVGCGQGGHAKFFENPASLGIDISQVAIAKAKKNFPKKRFEVVNILNFNSDELFDYVIDSKMINCLNHISLDLYLLKIKHHGCFLSEIAIHPDNYKTIAGRYIYKIEQVEQLMQKYFKYIKITFIENYAYSSPGMRQSFPVITLIASNFLTLEK